LDPTRNDVDVPFVDGIIYDVAALPELLAVGLRTVPAARLERTGK
jgi:hypothetical protein